MREKIFQGGTPGRVYFLTRELNPNLLLGGLQTIEPTGLRSRGKCREGSRVKDAGAARVELDVFVRQLGGGTDTVGVKARKSAGSSRDNLGRSER